MTMGKRKLPKNMRDDNFIPPDGGWGWMIVLAAGLSNLSTFPVLQQFGLLFRDKFGRLGISSSQTTTIININSAATACVGLANGPIFRIFTFRQVSFVGATVVFIGLIMTTFANSFITYLVSFSILYGAGIGISTSANALALNTYFKSKRRIATGMSWTTTGLGPMVWPHIITALFHIYNESDTVLLMTGFALHAVACALLLQPVEWHCKTIQHKDAGKLLLSQKKDENREKQSGYFSSNLKFKNVSAFSSQYLYNEDDPLNTGYEIIDPGTPMLVKGNDGYFSGSKKSLNKLTSSKSSSLANSSMPSKRPSSNNLQENRSRKSSVLNMNDSRINTDSSLNLIERETYKAKRKPSISDTRIPELEIEDCPTLKAPQDLRDEEKKVVENLLPEHKKSIADKAEKHYVGSKSLRSFKMDDAYTERYQKNNHSNASIKNHESNNSDKTYNLDNHSIQSQHKVRKTSNNFNYENEILLKQASLKLEKYLNDKQNQTTGSSVNIIVEDMDKDAPKLNLEENETDGPVTFIEKIIVFFDLDLLRDFTYVNLMVGMTIANFNELNFSILTPFILGDYGLSKSQVAMFMSLLAGIDLGIRFCIPFVAGKIGWENKSFFLFGVLTMAAGRIVLAHCQIFSVVLLAAVMIGFGKGLRTVFMALVIPTHVPLQKLPGATGMQLLTAGMFFLIMGPVVGWVKDNTSTSVTLHCLNIFTYVTAISWGLEMYCNSKKTKIHENKDDTK